MLANDQETRVQQVVFSHALERQRRVELFEKCVVHYTSADAAFNILKRKQIWMRSAIAMNDYSEIHYGESCLRYAWNSRHGNILQSILEDIYPGITDRIISDHNAAQNWIRANTHLTCVSEHEQSENLNGRLSMWRAYGGDTGVALVMRNGVIFDDTDNLKAYPSPVAYFSKEDFSYCSFQATFLLRGAELAPRTRNDDGGVG